MLLSQLGSEEGGQLAILTALELGVNLAARSRRGSLLWEVLSPLVTRTQLSPGFRILSPALPAPGPSCPSSFPVTSSCSPYFPEGPTPMP